MKKLFLLSFFICSLGLNAQDSLRLQIAQISKLSKGILCVSIENLESGDTLSFNGTYHCPMQSVFKFPIALTILDMVDEGKLNLDDKVKLNKKILSDSNTMSSLRDHYHNPDTGVSIGELLGYMVSNSDNIACDLLIEKAGGPPAVENHIHGLGVNGIAIAANEHEMHVKKDLQYKSWCEPVEMTKLFKLFYKGKCLSKTSTDCLMKLLIITNTGAKRIKGLLPEGVVVAHKTGSAFTEKGLTAATNDAGIITLPNGHHLIITVFLTDSKANDSTRDAVIAQVAKATYDKMKDK